MHRHIERRKFLVTGISALVVSKSTQAQEQEADRLHALVIGNAAYLRAGRLANPVNDARGVRDQLRKLTYSVTYGEDLTKAQTIEVIRRFVRDVDAEQDAMVFYYAGHGVQIGRENYIVTVDADFSTQDKFVGSLLALSDVARIVKLRGKLAVLIVDACRNNPFVDEAKVGFSRGILQIPVGLRDVEAVLGTDEGLSSRIRKLRPMRLPSRSPSSVGGGFAVFEAAPGFFQLFRLCQENKHWMGMGNTVLSLRN